MHVPASTRLDPGPCDAAAPKGDRSRRRPEIKLRQLRYFLAGAEYLHFSKAAETQFVTQSTLSHQIAELEMQIGQPLFDRSARSVRLTQAGEVLKVYAMRIVNEVDAGCSALLDLDNIVSGSLRIGATQSFVHRHLGSVLGTFIAQNPAVRLHVEELTAPQIGQQLSTGQLDLGIAFAPATMCDINVEALDDEEMVLVTNVDHRLADAGSVRMEELAYEPIALLSSDHLSRRHIDSCFRKAGVAPRIVVEANNLALMLDLVRCSGIAAIVPSCMADAKAGVRAVALTDPTPRRTVALLRSRHHHESEASRLLAMALRQRFDAEPLAASGTVSRRSLAVC